MSEIVLLLSDVRRKEFEDNNKMEYRVRGWWGCGTLGVIGGAVCCARVCGANGTVGTVFRLNFLLTQSPYVSATRIMWNACLTCID